MNGWLRTITGKTLLFFGCILSICVLIFSVIGALLMVKQAYYTNTKEELFYDLTASQLRGDCYEILNEHFYAPHLFKEDKSNLLYELLDEEGTRIAASQDFDQAETEQGLYSFKFYVFFDKEGNPTDVYYDYQANDYDPLTRSYTVRAKFRSEFPQWDEYALAYWFIRITHNLRYWVYIIAVAALLSAIASFIALMCVAARKPHTEELRPGPLHRFPLDLLLLLLGLAGIAYIYLCDLLFYQDELIILALIFGVFLSLNIALGLCMSIAARVKQKTLWRTTVVGWLWRLLCKAGRFLGKLIQSIPLVWRTALILFGLTAVEFLAIAYFSYEVGTLLLYWLLGKILLIPAVLYIAVSLRKLQKAGNALAAGDLHYQTDTRDLVWDFKTHGENLNSIAKGMTIAVEEQLKSERMKTELITNVSHDLKTPLTSIVNYAGLISKEPCENQNITEYAEVLVRQSERLTRLIEDLVEASKASTGNLEVHLSPCDALVFMTQTGGEYAEKLEACGLTLITKQPEEAVMILADGRRMWRIFDNLMNNICKYAQSGTRVYLTLDTTPKEAVITFKNTSRAPLDVSEAELMERFVRGDASRNTEGNGLGLSIAKSLAELQGGSLRLETDGDLFKAILTFPLIR